ncbi:MAG: transposase [Lentisphaeria bacterium]|nr:integrase core domain-containing protein [Lentisphaeria bacterium]NQZ68611.1 transposase [Lentisphaeria bacterium]
MARENRSWGAERIHGQLKNINITVSTESIRLLLRKHGIFPKPDRESQGTWKEFIARHKDVLWATDFFTTEVLTLTGLKTVYVLFFIHLETRRVVISGMTEYPNAEWMQQQARNLTGFDGDLSQAKYLIHDRDSKYSKDFAQIMQSAGIETIKLPPRSPNLNAYAERFVRSIKDECLSKFIPIGEKFLRHIIKEYIEHYHHERNHQGDDIGDELLFSEINPVVKKNAEIQTSSRLGGLLNFYHREAA